MVRNLDYFHNFAWVSRSHVREPTLVAEMHSSPCSFRGQSLKNNRTFLFQEQSRSRSQPFLRISFPGTSSHPSTSHFFLCLFAEALCLRQFSVSDTHQPSWKQMMFMDGKKQFSFNKKRSKTYLQQVKEVETSPLREKTKLEEDELVWGIKDASDGQEQSLCFTLHPRKWLRPKTIGNRKGGFAWSCSRWQTQPEKISKLQRTNQCPLRTLYWFVLCNLQIFSGCVCHLVQLHAQSPFLFPIVFGLNLMPFSDTGSVLAVLCSNMRFFTWAAARWQLSLFVALAAGLWCFTRAATSNLSLFPKTPLKQKCASRWEKA